MCSNEDVDVKFLRETGAASAINLAVRQLLISKPADPAAFLIELLAARRLPTSADDLRALLAATRGNAERPFASLSLKLLVEAMFGIDSPSLTSYPLVGPKAAVGGNFGGVAPYVAILPSVAEALAAVLRREAATPSPFTTAALRAHDSASVDGSPTSTNDNASFASAAGSESKAGGARALSAGRAANAIAAAAARDAEIAEVLQCEAILAAAIARVSADIGAARATSSASTFVRCASQLATSRLKLEAIARRNTRTLHAQRVAEAAAAAATGVQAGGNAEAALPAANSAKDGADAKATTANSSTPAPSQPKDQPTIDSTPAPPPLVLHVVVPLRTAADFVDNFAEAEARLRWAFATSFPSVDIQFLWGEDSFACTQTPGRDGQDPEARYPGNSVRAVTRTIHSDGCADRVTVVPNSGSNSGFVGAIAAAARYPPALVASGAPPTTQRRIVLVLDNAEPTTHLGAVGNFLFPMLVVEGGPSASMPLSTVAPHMGGGGAGLSPSLQASSGTAASAVETGSNQKGGVAGAGNAQGQPASKKQQQQQQQLAAAAAAAAAGASAGPTASGISPYAVLIAADSAASTQSAASAVSAALVRNTVDPWTALARRTSSIGGSVVAVAFDAAALQPLATDNGESDAADLAATLQLPGGLRSTRTWRSTILAEVAVSAAERAGTSLHIVDAVNCTPVRPIVLTGGAVAESAVSLAHTVLSSCVPAVAERERDDGRKAAEALCRALVALGGDGASKKVEALIASDAARRAATGDSDGFAQLAQIASAAAFSS